MKKPKQTVAERTAALTSHFPKHPHHDAFLDAAIALRAEDLASQNVAPLEGGAARRKLSPAQNGKRQVLEGIV